MPKTSANHSLLLPKPLQHSTMERQPLAFLVQVAARLNTLLESVY